MTLKELTERTPFGATVTWLEFLALLAESTSVAVCFVARSENPKDPIVGRAIIIPKEVAAERAADGIRWHPKGDERVNVYACAGTLYFGGQ